MSASKGFTLIELIVVLVIVGILAALAVPNYNNYLQQGAAKSAQNNLITIYDGQKTYYLSPGNGGSYYNSPSANDLAGINTALVLNITDNNFQYKCITAAGPTFSCTATNASNGNLSLTVTNNPIILPSGTGCTASPWAAPCNPSCSSTNNPAYCPTN